MRLKSVSAIFFKEYGIGRRQEDCSTRQSNMKRAPFRFVINAIAARQLGFAFAKWRSVQVCSSEHSR